MVSRVLPPSNTKQEHKQKTMKYRNAHPYIPWNNFAQIKNLMAGPRIEPITSSAGNEGTTEPREPDIKNFNLQLNMNVLYYKLVCAQ